MHTNTAKNVDMNIFEPIKKEKKSWLKDMSTYK